MRIRLLGFAVEAIDAIKKLFTFFCKNYIPAKFLTQFLYIPMIK
jgi:hypothetical protein